MGGKVVDVYHSSAVTPYIHAMSQHAAELIQIHGSLLSFAQQELEKCDITTKYFFRSTNHKRETAM